MTPDPQPDLARAIETDAVVIGGGPVGLFQVFQLGLHEIHAELVDALPHLGGQCAELYPDKPIYDIPGLPSCSGRELVQRLSEQMAPMRPGLHLGQTVERLVQDGDTWELTTSAGRRLRARVVVIAAGVGAFEPRRLKLAGLEGHEGRQLHHRMPEPARLAGRDVTIVGGEESAVDAALELTDPALEPALAPRRVTLLHRRDAFKAEPDALATLRARIDSGRLHLELGQPVGFATAPPGEQPDDGDDAGAQRLESLTVVRADTSTDVLPVDLLLVRLGLSPRLGPLADWGLAMERKQLVVDTAAFETSLPGVHAVGDVNTYPGKKKLILCGFHEATLAAFAAAARLFPDRPQHLQYTTTSPRLHRLLGRAAPPAAAGPAVD